MSGRVPPIRLPRWPRSAASPGSIPLWVAVPLAVALTIAFVGLLFPWDAVARRLAFEIGAASGAPACRMPCTWLGAPLCPEAPPPDGAAAQVGE